MLYSAGICPDGSPPVNCLVNPCKTASCPAVADATCTVEDAMLAGSSMDKRSLTSVMVRNIVLWQKCIAIFMKTL